MSLKLDVSRITVDLSTLAGERRQADFFVPVSEGMTSPSARLAHQLNDPQIEFLPCRIGDQTVLLRIDSITSVEIGPQIAELTELEEVGTISHGVELQLANGEKLDGALLVEGSEYACRVSDHLNRGAGRFLLLRTDDAVIYVNRAAVTSVREEGG